MKRVMLIGLLGLSACVASPLREPGRMDATPVPFPYPGTYYGAVRGGTVAYRIGPDGRGLSCVRAINGRMAFGQVVYDGGQLQTEDAPLDVVRATPGELVIGIPGVEPRVLKKVEEAPVNCQEFFSKGR